MSDDQVMLRFRGPYVPEKDNYAYVRLHVSVSYLNNTAYMEAVKRYIALPKLQVVYADLDSPVHLKVSNVELIPDF